jgi:hypothetical protein
MGLLWIFASLVQPGWATATSGLTPLPHDCLILFLYMCIIFFSIVSVLTEGITPHLLDPSTHFLTVLLWNASKQRHVLQQYIPDPSTMF